MTDEFRNKLRIVLEGIAHWHKGFSFSLTEETLTTNFGSADVSAHAKDNAWLEILNHASSKMVPSIYDMVQGALAYLWAYFFTYEDQVFCPKHLGGYGYGVCNNSDVTEDARSTFQKAVLENTGLQWGEVDFPYWHGLNTPRILMDEAGWRIETLKAQGYLDDIKIDNIWRQFQDGVSPVYIAAAFDKEWLDDNRATLARINAPVIKFMEHFKFLEHNSDYLELCAKLDK